MPCLYFDYLAITHSCNRTPAATACFARTATGRARARVLRENLMSRDPFAPHLPDRPVWAMSKGHRTAECRIVPHPIGFELRIDIDGDTRLTQAHRLEADADIHAATLEDQFIERGWV